MNPFKELVYNRPYSNFKIDRNINKKIIVTEEQFNKLKEYLINESLSIADDVSHAMVLVLTEIQDQLDQKQTSGQFDFDFFGETFNVVWKMFDYQEDTTEPKGAKVDFGKRVLTVEFSRVDGTIQLWNLRDSLQHEIEHIYQWVKKPTRDLFSPRRGKIYDKIVDGLGKYPKESIQYKILQAIYISYPEEQDAFVNGLYSVLNQCKNPIQISMIKSDSPAMALRRNLVKINYKLNNDQEFIESEEFKEILTLLGKDFKWVKSMINKGTIRFARKMAHVEKKAIQNICQT